MLNEVLRLLKDSKGPVRLEEIARALGRPPSAVEGMLETLERLGKVERVETELCARCPAKLVCVGTGGNPQCYRLKSADER